MTTIPDFKTFTFPVIRGKQKDSPPRPHDHHRHDRILTSLRCPGCCGPVVATFFKGYDYGRAKKGDYYAYTCGSLTLKMRGETRWLDFKVGPHGTLAYLELTDRRRLQNALDEEFQRRQDSREQELKEFEESGDEFVTVAGCFPGVTRQYVPQGKLETTEHGVNCACTHNLSS